MSKLNSLSEKIRYSINLSKKINIGTEVWLHYFGTNDPRPYVILEINKNKILVEHKKNGPLKNGPKENRYIYEIISIIKN